MNNDEPMTHQGSGSDLVDCSAALVAANAEIARLKAAMEWRAIETAPKDGKPILISHPEAGVCEAFCPGDDFAWHCMDGINTRMGSRSGMRIPVMTTLVTPPTHWMPLPEALQQSTPAPLCPECNGSGEVAKLTGNGWMDLPCRACLEAKRTPTPLVQTDGVKV